MNDSSHLFIIRAICFYLPQVLSACQKGREELFSPLPHSSLLGGLVIFNSETSTSQLCSRSPPDTNLVAGHLNGHCGDSWRFSEVCVAPGAG